MTSVIERRTGSGSGGAPAPSILNAPAMPHMKVTVVAERAAETSRPSRVTGGAGPGFWGSRVAPQRRHGAGVARERRVAPAHGRPIPAGAGTDQHGEAIGQPATRSPADLLLSDRPEAGRLGPLRDDVGAHGLVTCLPRVHEQAAAGERTR